MELVDDVTNSYTDDVDATSGKDGLSSWKNYVACIQDVVGLLWPERRSDEKLTFMPFHPSSRRLCLLQQELD